MTRNQCECKRAELSSGRVVLHHWFCLSEQSVSVQTGNMPRPAITRSQLSHFFSNDNVIIARFSMREGRGGEKQSCQPPLKFWCIFYPQNVKFGVLFLKKVYSARAQLLIFQIWCTLCQKSVLKLYKKCTL